MLGEPCAFGEQRSLRRATPLDLAGRARRREAHLRQGRVALQEPVPLRAREARRELARDVLGARCRGRQGVGQPPSEGGMP